MSVTFLDCFRKHPFLNFKKPLDYFLDNFQGKN